MRTALITTTVNVPKVLELYRACSSEVMFIVTGDKKTPDADVANFLFDCGDHLYLGAGAQGGWRCSELIGWNTIARRNIALLEALRWGADVIISIDDDNFPLATDYFDRFEMVLGGPFSGLAAVGKNKWFDPGQMFIPKVRHRGFPHQIKSDFGIQPVVGAKVGLATGPVLGNPDIGAVERIAKEPDVIGLHEVMRQGLIIDPQNTWTVVNTQNTAYLREFAPCFLMIPAFGRNDDIFASLVAQRIMRDRSYVTHYGSPLVFQERNEHDLMKDLRAEIWGMETILEFVKYLDNLPLENRSVIEDLRRIWGEYDFDKVEYDYEAISSPLHLVHAWFEDVQEATK